MNRTHPRSLRRPPGAALSLTLALSLGACSGAARTNALATLGRGQSETMTAMGFRPVGAPITARVEGNGSKRHLARLEAGVCYQLVALPETDAPFELALVNPAGQRAATGERRGRGTSLRFCPANTGDFHATVAAQTRPVTYLLGVWREPEGYTPPREGTSASENPRGTCAAPESLALGQTVEGSTAQARDNASGTCLRGRGPDVIYRLEVPTRRRVALTARTDFDAALYLQRECGRVSAEVSCCNLAVSRGVSRIDTVLEAGTYFVVIDTLDDGRRGHFTLSAEESAAPELARVCSALPEIAPATTVQGDTSNRPDLMRGTCASGNFPGPDRAYALTLREPSRVRATVRTDGGWDPGLYLRRGCNDPSSELACNDDAEGIEQARVERSLEAGSYTLVVDGYVAGSQGPYSLEVERAPAAGEGLAAGDSCANAAPLAAGGVTRGDTFRARDDAAGSCGGGDGAPDAVYRVNITRRSHFSAELDGGTLGTKPDGARMYITRACGNPRAELACGTGRVDAMLAPGAYYLVVDGASRNHFGAFSLRHRVDDAAQVTAACRAVPVLTAGAEVRGRTEGPDRLHASCGNHARSAERVYSLRLTERRTVTVTARGDYDTVLSLRTQCDRDSSEVACDDDDTGPRDSRIERTLDAGTYFVVVDGFDQGNQGDFTLLVTTAEPRPEPPTAVTLDTSLTQLRDPGAGTNAPGSPAGNPCGGAGANPCGGGNPCGGARANPCAGNPCAGHAPTPPPANPSAAPSAAPSARPSANPCAPR